MKPAHLLFLLALALGLLFHPHGASADDLREGFADPPASARPWVYWFWLNGNITREGITADLEAMARTGIGGVLIMEVDQGAPLGPVPFMGEAWRELFSHVLAEADRLDLEVNMNNDAGWNGSGGPWIKPEESMQKVVWTETQVQRVAGQPIDVVLPRPETVAGYYRDIAVLAFPTPGAGRIDNLPAKTSQVVGSVGPVVGMAAKEGDVVDHGRLVDLSERMDGEGRLNWDGPAAPGAWTILRLGHTSTGVNNAPAPASGRGLECDKLSKAGIEANFAGMMGKLIADAGPLAGKALAATHIDSWENGAQNWTARMQQEFAARRGYEMAPFLPVYAGFIVDGLETSERFLWDLRQTVSELVHENYAGHMKELANAKGLRFTVEAYGGPCEDLAYAGRSDEPMAEFWVGGGALETCKRMASAAHAYGKTVVGAEAFTAADQERWLDHPATIKALGDRAFCDGINRFVFHRYAMQPWLDRKPGMTMGPWGVHYERTQTWWELTPSWHAYLARCQHMLRQGQFVADICYLQPESSMKAYQAEKVRGHDYDMAPPELVLSSMYVDDGLLALPGGMRYSLLVLPMDSLMRPALLAKIEQLVRAGGAVLGAPPVKSPSLERYPECDAQVRRLAGEIWADCDGKSVTERAYGEGKVFRGLSTAEALSRLGIDRDFDSDRELGHIHRRTAEADIYFVANPEAVGQQTVCRFRVHGKRPELWRPESGETVPAPLYSTGEGGTTVSLYLGPSESVFVVFREKLQGKDPVVGLYRNGECLADATVREPEITIVEARYGVPGRMRDVREEVAARVAAGHQALLVAELAQSGDPAEGVLKTLTVSYTVDGEPVVVQGQDPDVVHLDYAGPRFKIIRATYGVPGDPVRRRDVREKLQRLLDTGRAAFRVAELAQGDDPAYMVVKTLDAEYEAEGRHGTLRGTDNETLRLTSPEGETPVAVLKAAPDGAVALEGGLPGAYEVVFASGARKTVDVSDLPPDVSLEGPWALSFPQGEGRLPMVTLDRLVSWSGHALPDIQHYSGTGVYTTTFELPQHCVSGDTRLALDLGDVKVMARVSLNGKDLGVLWKAPFEIDISEAARAGMNRLSVEVTNLWINRMIGDEQLPEDSERHGNGTLKAWPAWLAAGEPSPAGRTTFTTWRLWGKDDPLQPSGLLGPVVVRSRQVVRVR